MTNPRGTLTRKEAEALDRNLPRLIEFGVIYNMRDVGSFLGSMSARQLQFLDEYLAQRGPEWMHPDHTSDGGGRAQSSPGRPA